MLKPVSEFSLFFYLLSFFFGRGAPGIKYVVGKGARHDTNDGHKIVVWVIYSQASSDVSDWLPLNTHEIFQAAGGLGHVSNSMLKRRRIFLAVNHLSGLGTYLGIQT